MSSFASVGIKGLVGDIGPQGRQGLDGNKGMIQREFLNLYFWNGNTRKKVPYTIYT